MKHSTLSGRLENVAKWVYLPPLLAEQGSALPIGVGSQKKDLNIQDIYGISCGCGIDIYGRRVSLIKTWHIGYWSSGEDKWRSYLQVLLETTSVNPSLPDPLFQLYRDQTGVHTQIVMCIL